MQKFAALLCTSLLVAQAPDPLRYVPEDADVVLQLVGPAAWRAQFADTGLGKAMAAEELQPVWGKLAEELGELMQLEEQPRELLQEFWNALSDYDGRLVLTGKIDWRRIDPFMDRLPGAILLALGPGAGLEAEELIEKVAELLPPEGGDPIEVAGQELPVREVGPLEMLGPFEHQGCLLMVVGGDLEVRAPMFFGDHEQRQPEGDIAAAFSFRMRTKEAIEALFDFALAGEVESVGMLEMFRALGMASVDEVAATVFADGEFVGQTVEVGFDGDRGLFDVVFPPRDAAPSLLRYLPPGAGTYSAWSIDGPAIEGVARKTIAAVEEWLPLDVETIEQQFTEMTKLDLWRDVLGQVGNEFLRIDDVAAPVDFDAETTPVVDKADERFGDACFVIALRDGEKFANDLDKAIRARGLHVGRKREAYGDHRIYRMTLLGMLPIEYAVTDKLLVIGVGKNEGTQRNLRGVLDAVAQRADEPPFSDDVQRRLQGLPDGWAGIDVGSLTDAIDGFVGIVDGLEVFLASEDMTLEDIDQPYWATVRELGTRLRPVLLRHGVATAIKVDYLREDRYVARSRW